MAYQNFFAAKLYTDIGAGDTTITLDTAPTATSGRMVLEARNPTQREIIKYSGVSGNQLTGVLRGQGGTTAKPHLKNALIEMNITAEDLSDALGVPGDIVTRFDESFGDFVVSGCGVYQISLLNGGMTPGIVYINGNRLNVATVSSYSYPSSKDIYVDIDSSGTVVYTPVANGATSGFALAPNRIRIALVVTNATTITGVQQYSVDPTTNTIIYPTRFDPMATTHVRATVASTYTSGSPETIRYSLKTYDTLNEFNIATYTWTCTKTGLYQITAQEWWGSAGAGTTENAEVIIYVNGGAALASDKMNGSGDANRLLRPKASGTIFLKPGDTVYARHTGSAGVRDVVAGNYSYIEIHRIA